MPVRVNSASAAAVTNSTPILRQGSSGSAVVDLQRKLAAAGFNPGGADGLFGPNTRAAVLAFQRSHGLAADGIVGPQTWGALNRAGGSAPRAAPTAPAGSHPMLRRGSSGGAVVEMQRKLAASGFNPGAVDGDFGPATERALRAFQRNRGLEADGVCGPRTWAALDGTSFDPDPRRDTRGLRERILSVAQGEVGTTEANNRNDGGVLKYPRYFGRGSEAYCADFVSWVFSHAGKPMDFAYCPYLKNHLVAEGKWKGRSNPQPGDIVLFDWDHDRVADHVGIVRGVNPDGSILTIEGNTENPSTGREGVWNRTRSMSDILGFGEP